MQLANPEGIEVFENGISGPFEDEKVRIGSREFLARELQASPDLTVDAKKPEHSLVFMGYAGRMCAVFVFGESIILNALPILLL